MVPPHESITLVDASGALINQLEGWGLEHQGLGQWKGCILCRGEGYFKKLRSCFIGDSPGSGEHWWELRIPHSQMPEKGSGIRKIGYYLFQPANPTTKIQGLEVRGSIEDDLVEGTSASEEVSKYSIIFRLIGDSFKCLKYTLVFSTSTQWKFVHKVEQDVKTCL